MPLPTGSAVAIASGERHVCAVDRQGAVWCWGFDGIAGPTENVSFKPVQIEGVAGASRIAAGDNTTCAIATGGAVSCWGAISNSTSAVAIAGIEDATRLDVGPSHACAVRGDGSVWSVLALADEHLDMASGR